FIPQAKTIDQKEDRRLWVAAVLLAELVNMHAAATWVMENEPWDFMAICDTSIDHFCHGFMHYHPPRMEHVPEQDFSLYKGVVNGCYRFHDMLLGRLLELAGEDTTVLLCSDHGYTTIICDRSLPRRSLAVWPSGTAHSEFWRSKVR